MSKYGELFIRKLKSGKYQGVMKYKDEKGTWRQITKTAKATLKRDAKKELQGWEAEIREAESKDASFILNDNRKTRSVSEVCLAYYEHRLAIGRTTDSTYFSDVNNFRCYVEPYIGDYGFTDIDRIVINKWITDLSAKGYKQSTVRIAMSIVAKVYNYYYEIEEIDKNPFLHVKLPPLSAPKTTFLDSEQLDKLMESLNSCSEEGEGFWTAVNLAVLAGLRRGEICGLRWNDVNLETGYLTISTAIGKSKDGFYAKPPKTKSSIRTFPMTPQLKEVLEARKILFTRVYGDTKPSDYVCGYGERFLSPDYFSFQFSEFVRKYDLRDHYGKYITLHGLRHNFATLGVKGNLDIASLSRMLGHASKAMTLDTYADASPEAMRLATEKMKETMSKETEFLDYTD